VTQYKFPEAARRERAVRIAELTQYGFSLSIAHRMSDEALAEALHLLRTWRAEARRASNGAYES
jgi:hypothetical protein